MTATIIAFPTAERLTEVELDRAGINPLERALDKACAIAAAITSSPASSGSRSATLVVELGELVGMIRRLERSHPLAVDDEAIIPLGAAMIFWPLRGVPGMLAELLAA